MSDATNHPNPSNASWNPVNNPLSPSPPTDEKENLLWEGSFSSKAMFGTWLSNALITFAVVVASIVLPVLGPLTWLFALGFILVLWLVTGSIFLYRRFSIHYQVTSQRLIHQRGILVRITDRIELIDIDDLSFSQSLVQRFLGVGSITISGSDKTDPVLIMLGIDQVAKVAGIIDDARRSERRKHSVHIESI